MSNLSVLPGDRLQDLVDLIWKEGYEVIGPTVESGAVVYRPITRVDQLPRGYVEVQGGGSYRLEAAAPGDGASDAYFAHVVGPDSWKRCLFPPRQKLWSATRGRKGFAVETAADPPRKRAFLGARACELAAVRIQDGVFLGGDFKDSGYAARRQDLLMVAVDCQRAGETCFCASLGTGPGVGEGFDIALTEFAGQDGAGDHHFLARSGSRIGAQLLERLGLGQADGAGLERRSAQIEATAGSLARRLPPDAPALLVDNPEHPRWQEVARRCLNCGNCTMVCPTCFCSTVEDVTSLDGASAERWRHWDSCFTVDFSFIHGGPIRRGGAARYRHWITHKLAHWHAQFGSSGCTGCGRCITWCPVGIDITEEVRALSNTPGAEMGGR